MLKKVINELKKNKPNYPINYAIPKILVPFSDVMTCDDFAIVNPYDYFIKLINDIYLKKEDKTKNYLNPLSIIKNEKKPWYEKSFFYSLMPRVSAAWDSDRTGRIKDNIYGFNDMGTFIKMLTVMPYLKKMGINTLYLLPIFKYSKTFKKGDLGSPYAVSNYFKLDENLKDNLTGSNITLEEEFKAFIMGAHLLDMRIVLDIIPRTQAINSDLLFDHPDWFYWIDKDYLSNYKPPKIKKIKEDINEPTTEIMEIVYNDKGVKEYLSNFRYDPKTKDREKWNQIRSLAKNTDELLYMIKKEFNIVVAPAYSDHINDIQPAWSDITFLRLYLDHPIKTKKFVKNDQPPYILFDVIKGNLYQGQIKNTKLWDLISDIIPYYQKNYGIDGARIDMGHALPDSMVSLIINKAKKYDKYFLTIAEELNPTLADIRKKQGYDMIIGNGFIMEKRIKEEKLIEFINQTKNLSLPAFANCETHDTPRIAATKFGTNRAKLLTLLNLFLPNAIPFLNSGQELLELQPMNLGLDATKKDLLNFKKSHPLYKKLALFDYFYFDYKKTFLHDFLEKCFKIRKKYLKYLTPENFLWLKTSSYKKTYAFSYKVKNGFLIFVANTNLEYKDYIEIETASLIEKENLDPKFKVLFQDTNEKEDFSISDMTPSKNLYIMPSPGELRIFLFKRKSDKK